MPSSSEPKYTFEQFSAVRRYGSDPFIIFSPDGMEVAYTVNTTGQLNLWRQPASGGFPRQVTAYLDRSVRSAVWSPDGRTLTYTADFQGDEMTQVFSIPAPGGRPMALTDAPNAQHFTTGGSYSRNGRYLAYFANDRNPAAMDILVRDLRTETVTRLLADEKFYAFGAWSPDARHFLAIDVKGNTNTDIWLVTRATGAQRLLTEHTGEARFFPVAWAPDGAGFYLITDDTREHPALAYHDISTGTRSWVIAPDWEVEGADLSADGRLLAWVVNEHGYSRLYVRNQTTRKLLTLPALPEGVIPTLTFSPTGDRLGLIINTPTHGPEIYVIDLRKRTLHQLTFSMYGGIDERDLLAPKLITYPTHDARKIPAFLYRPQGASRKQRRPIVLSIHGGPESQERPQYLYSGLYQYLLSRGIGVLAPNIRGSSGYGKSYQKLIHHDWGGAELGDIRAAAEYLRGLDWVDPERIGVFGGSFGGFATLSALSRLPEYWAVGVDLVGPSNLVTFVKSVPPHWRRFTDKWVGSAETEADFLMERSPITYVDKIRAPLFIIQGAHDPRVVKAESDQIVERLRKRGVDVQYEVFEDEGHGFTKRENELKGWRMIAEFLEHHLVG